MSAAILDGRKIARAIEEEMAHEVRALQEKNGITPQLTVILVGDDPASHVYVQNKSKACRRVGISEETCFLPTSISEAELLALIAELNRNPKVHGILVQMPLPSHISSTRVLEALDYRKDVDGFHPYNVGRAAIGHPLFQPCTPSGILELLLRSGYSPNRAHVVIVGRSNVVGKPLMNMLIQKTPQANATLTVCHTGTPDISAFTRQADILVAAAGYPEVIHGSMLRKGCVVVDVGVNRVEDPSTEKGYRLVGDVHFESAKEVAAAISPVPGGVGPMTIAMLVKNTLRAAQLQAGLA